MKKSIVFLVNGLGIEKPGSYSIAIDQCMPKLSRTKETSFYTSAIVNSLEEKSAYQDFFLGDTFNYEVDYIKNNVVSKGLKENQLFNTINSSFSREGSKLHIFVEPTNDKIVEEINNFVNNLTMNDKKAVFLHLILTQQATADYDNLSRIINYIKFRLNSHITVGFVLGKEYLNSQLTKDELSVMKKLFFFCSAERWTDTTLKLEDLKKNNIPPCKTPGFCATNECIISNNDIIMFFNTRKSNYDNIIDSIYLNVQELFTEQQINLPIYSVLRLDSKYQIQCFIESIPYENSLANVLSRNNLKALIITYKDNIQYINFLVNGFNHVTNQNVQFMDNSYSVISNMENTKKIIDESDFNLIIFDYHMDVSKTVNDLKEQLVLIDNVLGNVVDLCENKHSLFITSLYGIKKEMPLADYNTEQVIINYEMQIPIFFFDYSYLQSKYYLAPGYTNDILMSSLKCLCNDDKIDTLIRTKGFLNNLFKKRKQ